MSAFLNYRARREMNQYPDRFHEDRRRPASALSLARREAILRTGLPTSVVLRQDQPVRPPLRYPRKASYRRRRAREGIVTARWEADHSASFKRRLGKSASELNITDNNPSCPDMWELDNGDFAIIGRDVTEAYDGRTKRTRTGIRHPVGQTSRHRASYQAISVVLSTATRPYGNSTCSSPRIASRPRSRRSVWLSAPPASGRHHSPSTGPTESSTSSLMANYSSICAATTRGLPWLPTKCWNAS
ncbi:hypothetical protein ABIA31_007036 [Catenulispora sp. MAP5-51]